MIGPARLNVIAVWLLLTAVALIVAVACSGSDQPSVTAPDFLVTKLGGTTSAREFRGRPFHQSARSLDNDELRRFGAGADVFDQRMTVSQGVGPTFNEDSCLSCHLDGVRQVDKPADLPGPGLLLRLSVPGATPSGAPKPDRVYGGQLQTQSIAGVPA